MNEQLEITVAVAQTEAGPRVDIQIGERHIGLKADDVMTLTKLILDACPHVNDATFTRASKAVLQWV